VSEEMDWLASQQETARTWHRTVASVTAALQRLQIAKDSRNGEVGVTVDSHGRVQDIRLNPQALELRPERLAQLILETIKSAERDAAEHAADLSRPITDDPRITETLRAANELLGQPVLPGPSKPAKSTTDSGMDDYYLNRKSWLI
jgi:DNA-binding protein YbaB